MQWESSGEGGKSEALRQLYDASSLARNNLKERIKKLREDGRDEKANVLEENYFPEELNNKRNLDAFDKLNRNIRKIPLGVGSGSWFKIDATIEAYFDEILKEGPEAIANETKIAKEIKDLEDSGKTVPSELKTFKEKFKMFDEVNFMGKLETNRTAIENPARFFENRSPTGTPTGSPRCKYLEPIQVIQKI